jgi:hypothetical protein
MAGFAIDDVRTTDFLILLLLGGAARFLADAGCASALEGAMLVATAKRIPTANNQKLAAMRRRGDVIANAITVKSNFLVPAKAYREFLTILRKMG